MAIPHVRQQGYSSVTLSTIEIHRADEKIRPRDLIPATFDSQGFFLDRYLTQYLPPDLEWIQQP